MVKKYYVRRIDLHKEPFDNSLAWNWQEVLKVSEVKEAIENLPKEVIGTDEKMISADKLKKQLGIK